MTYTPFESDSQNTQVEVEAQWPAISVPLPSYTKNEELADAKYEVTLDPEDDPMQFSPLRKWVIELTICFAALCVATASSAAAFTEDGVARDLHVSREVTILAISLFIEGLGIGPLLVGPLSELYGRNVVYRASYICFFALSWPVAFPPNITVYLIFRFLTGFAGSAFLCVGGGSVGDLFSDHNIAGPMAVYTLFPFIGPVLGPVLSGFINQHLEWRWTYRIFLIWQFVEFVSLCVLVPETYVPIILKAKAARLRKETGNAMYYTAHDLEETDVIRTIMHSCTTPFKLLFYDRMALLLDIWDALILGILYMTFQAFPIIFEDLHGFNYQCTGMAFLGIGLGMIIALLTQPWWNRLLKSEGEKNGGETPPESRLLMGQAGAVLAPVGLFWMAFTTYKDVHWIVPIIASIPFGTGILYIFTSTFSYLVTAYRPVAASAMAGNSALRSTFAAAFPLFAGAMYHKLGTVGATALLAGLATVVAPLPFIYYKIGARLRASSRFAAKT